MDVQINRAKEFIINELDALASSFPCARFRYEYDDLADVHVVEASPNELYHNNNKYIARERDLASRFIELFPDQNICFIPDDDIVGISRVDHEARGVDFGYSITIRFDTQFRKEDDQLQDLDFYRAFEKLYTMVKVSLNSVESTPIQAISRGDSEVLPTELTSCNYPMAA